MPKLIRLGILTPSSNVNLEPITQSIIASMPNVTLHFSRFSVAKLSLEEDALSQFQTEKMVEAAILLADAGVDMIGWCGNSSDGWVSEPMKTYVPLSQLQLGYPRLLLC